MRIPETLCRKKRQIFFWLVVLAVGVQFLVVPVMHGRPSRQVAKIYNQTRDATPAAGRILGPDHRKSGDVINIMSWTNKSAVKGSPWWHGVAFSGCGLPDGASCTYVHDRRAYNSSDVILFKGTQMRADDMPRFRPANQKWLFYELESPINTRRHVDFDVFFDWDLSNTFDYTVTFARDADMRLTYGECKKNAHKGLLASRKLHREQQEKKTKEKTALVAWFVSRCESPSRREQYVRELSKYIPVHIYGRCGTRECSRNNQTLCDEMLRQKYKFYLALENSLCDDYISEKFWKCFELDIVPVAYGAGQYDAEAPPGSFIDIHDYESPEDLANYLRYLNENDDLYNEYFNWKPHYTCGVNHKKNKLCELCRFLHLRKHKESRGVRSQGRYDITKRWTSKSRCISPKTFWEL